MAHIFSYIKNLKRQEDKFRRILKPCREKCNIAKMIRKMYLTYFFHTISKASSLNDKHLSNTNYLLGPVLGAGDTLRNKTNKSSCPHSSLWSFLHSSKESRLHNMTGDKCCGGKKAG